MPFELLKDFTVVECCTFVTGPHATALLAHLGARVIKIESPPEGDPYRYFAPDPHYSFNFAHLNRNKQSLALDLKSPDGKGIALELAGKADVFVENFRPGTAERLGLDYEALRAINARLVYCSISAFGRSGPWAEKPGFDTLGQAMSGLLSLLSDPDDPKVMGMAISDYVTGLSAGYGILGALLARAGSGVGCRVETSLLEATLSFIGESAAGYLRTSHLPDRMARVKNAHAFAFLCKDNLPLAIHCSVPEKFWVALLGATERPDLAADARFASRDARRRHYQALEDALAPTFRLRTRDEWLRLLEANDVPAAPLYNIAEAVAEPQVVHLELIEETDHPVVGRLRFIAPPVRYPDEPRQRNLPPPLLGEHSEAILRELGKDEATIRRLQEQRIIQTPGR
jgi:crotonobetainyl-CoA:carnitine CoA-transferase CaiB-like acyl-CoA transferase